MARRPGPLIPDYQPLGIRPTGPVQTLQSDGVARGLGTLSERLDVFLGRRLEREAQSAARQGAAAGAAAGAAGQYAEMDPETIRGAAYNRAALETYSRRLEADALDTLDRLAQEHEAAPQNLAAAAEAWAKGAAEGIPSQEGRAIFSASFGALVRPYVNAARRQADARVADERIATWTAAEPKRLSLVQRLAREAAAGDADANVALEGAMTALEGDLIALGPKSAFVFGGVEYPADPTRAGALTLAAIQERVNAYDAEVRENAVMGWWETGPKTQGRIDSWRKRELGPTGSGLTEEQIDQLTRRMEADRAKVDAGAAVGKAILRDRIASHLASLEATGVGVDGVTPATVAAVLGPAAAADLAAAEARSRRVHDVVTQAATATPDELAALLEGIKPKPGAATFADDASAAARAAQRLAPQEEAFRGLVASDLESRTTTGQGVDGVTPETVRSILGAAPAAAYRQAVAAAERQYRAVTAGKTASPEDRAAIAAAIAPKGGAGSYAADADVYGRVVAALKDQAEAIQADPAGYVVRTVGPVAGDELMEWQRRLGIPAGQERLLTKAQAAEIVGRLSTARGEGRADAIQALEGEYGADWPRVMGQLAAAGLPAEYRVLAMVDEPVARAELGGVLDTPMRDLERLAPTAGDLKTVKESLRSQMAPIDQALAHAPDGPQRAAEMEAAALRLALRRMQGGAAPDAAASGAVEALTSRMDIVRQGAATALAPRGWGGRTEAYGSQLVTALTPADVADPGPSPGALPADEATRRAAALDAARAGRWVINDTSDGWVRLDARGQPVRLADGSIMQLSFGDVPSAPAWPDPPDLEGRARQMRVTDEQARQMLVGDRPKIVTLYPGMSGYWGEETEQRTKGNDSAGTPRRLFVQLDSAGREVDSWYFAEGQPFVNMLSPDRIDELIADPDTFDPANPSNFEPRIFDVLQRYRDDPAGLKTWARRHPDVRLYKQETGR